MTDLINSILKNNLKSLKKLMNKGINVQDEYGWTTLVLIFKNIYTQETVQHKYIDLPVLLKEEEWASIMYYVDLGALERAELIIYEEIEGRPCTKQVNLLETKLMIGRLVLQEQEEVEEVKLMLAAKNGHIDIVKKQIDKGTDIEAKDEFGETALMFAVCYGHTDIVKLLIDKGADIDAKDRIGFNVLGFAIKEGNIEIVKLLIDTGADIEAKDDEDTTALMYAAKNGHTEIAELLETKLKEKTK